MKTKTKTKILKIFAVCMLFLGTSHVMAQTLPSNTPTQTVCVNSLVEPYEVVPVATSSYSWSIIDQSTGVNPLVGVADITTTPNDWTITVDWTTPGVYTLSVMETDIATSCSSILVDLVVTVEDVANPPLAPAPSAICLNDPNPQISASTGGGTGNSVFNWYADQTLTTLLQANSTTYTDPISYPSSGSYSYWVTEESVHGCEGLPTQVTVVVTPLPTAPTLASLPYEACFGLANPLFTASGSGGSNFNWYDASGTILPLGTNTPTFTSTETNPGTYTYFVEEIVGSCTSPQTSFTFIIHAPPAAPSITPSQITICEGDIPGNFTANSNSGTTGTFTWYDVDPVTNLSAISVGTGGSFIPTQINPGVYTYWLTESDLTTSCTSTTITGTFTINTLPLTPSVAASPSAVICDGDANPTFTATQGTGSTGTNNFNWYDVDPVANPSAVTVGTGSTFTPNPTAVGLYTFWVTENNSTTNCEGGALSFTFEIISLPLAPTYTPNPHEICEGDLNPTFSPFASGSGANLIWYDDALLSNQVGTGSTYVPGTNQSTIPSAVGTYNYWVVDQPGTCISPALQIDLQINPLPTPGPIWHN